MPRESDTTIPDRKSGKLISLRGHQAAEQAVDDLLAVGRQNAGFVALLARGFSLGAPFLSAIVRRLDASRPEELLVLAEVVGRYPGRGQAVRSLVRAANDRRANDPRRLGAALALAMYDYGVILPPLHDFLGGLVAPAPALASAMISSLDCYSRSAAPQDWEPLFALFISQPPEVLGAVIGAISEWDKEGVYNIVPLLRLLALHPHLDLMVAAVECLVTQPGVDSVRALIALQPNLPPDIGHSVGRHLLKLRLSGVFSPDTPQVPPACFQAWLSAVDGRGRCLLRLVRVTEEGTTIDGNTMGTTLELMLSDTQGIIDAAFAAGGADVGATTGLGVRDVAHHPLYGEQASHRQGHAVVPFAYSQGVIRQMARLNWSSGTGLPVAYLLECGVIWEGTDEIRVDPDEAWPDLTNAGAPVTGEEESALLSLPGFVDWYLDTPSTHLAAQQIAASSGGLSHELTDENWRVLLPSIIRVAHEEFVPETRLLYSNRLRMMAEWLYFKGERLEAMRAASAASTMVHSPPEANLFILRLVQKGILVALSQL